METRVGLLQELDPFACPLHGLRLIEASAGTGKTWNICGLYLRLLLEKGLTVQQLLVVTFTKAATAELRERLRARLVDALNGLRGSSQGAAAHDPFVRQLIATVTAQSGLSIEILAERVQTALHCFDEAAIFTIHSFCQRALADTPFAAGMPFSLELIQDDHLLCHEAVADFWRRHIASQEISPALADWLVARQDTPETWTALLKKMLAKSQSRVIWPEEDAVVGLPASAQPTELHEAYRRARAVWGDGLAATRALLDGIAALNATSYKPDSVAQAAQSWRDWFAADDPLATVDPDKRELFSAAMLQKRYKKNQSAPRHAFFDLADELLQLQQAQIDALNRARLHLLRRMLEETGRDLLLRKREQRCVSFDDMLFNMHRALSCGDYPWLAAAIRSAYPVALIDEFQDTDPLQFQIFSLLYPPDGLAAALPTYGPIFLVGDPKQAIYSFRNADLHTYLHAKSLSASPYTLIHNQRSSPALIAACNALFARNPQAFILDGLNYADVQVGAKPRTAFIDSSTDNNANGSATAGLHLWYLPDETTRSEAMQQVLQATAAEVARLIAAGQKVGADGTDEKGSIRLGARGLAPGDIAILVKSHRQGRAVKQALLRLGIGSVELSHNSIFDSNEAREMQVLLHAILEPTRPDRLYAALATELLGFSADRIEALAADENALLQTLQRFADYREIWTQRGFGSLMREFMNREAMPQRLLAYQDGERRLTNLLHLGELLQAASQQHPAAEALLRWLNACCREGAQDEVAQLRLESDRNLVQIVTIHKSKGLEYPIVFCPFLFDGHSRPMGRGEFREYHDENHAPVLDFRPESAEDEEIKRQRLRERDAEDMRLIYVALTRAVHRAYLVAGCYSSRNTVTESARSLLNWMAAGGAIDYDAWKSHKLGATEIRHAWHALAQTAGAALWLTDLPQRSAPPVELPRLCADQLQALPAPKRIPIAWRIGSFSHLHHGSRADGLGSDHDGHVGGHVVPIKTAPPATLADNDILHFPRGPSAGDCLHAIFERIDFADPASFDAAIERALLGFAEDQTAAAPLAAMLLRMLNDVLATPLRPGLSLQTIAPQRRLIELEFHLPTPHLDAHALNAWLAAHHYPLAPLDFYPLSGYLKGYVDLIFEHDGRFYILDWKSNHLGYTAADYGPDALAVAMSEHGYHLQYLLYAIALHRFLRQRLRNYDYRQHFGGVLYLFVRGVRPEWADSGVYFHLPELATLESLEGLLTDKA